MRPYPSAPLPDEYLHVAVEMGAGPHGEEISSGKREALVLGQAGKNGSINAHRSSSTPTAVYSHYANDRDHHAVHARQHTPTTSCQECFTESPESMAATKARLGVATTQ
jgi:hypothetical protein